MAIDRLWRHDQEFNLGHYSRAAFAARMAADADGRRLANDLTTLQVRSGFLRGAVIFDRDGVGDDYRQATTTVAQMMVAEACRRARNDWAYVEKELAKAVQRGDDFVFAHLLAQSTVVQLVALFAIHGQYYPGLKWVRQVMEDATIGRTAVEIYDRIWVQRSDPRSQLNAANALAAWISDAGSDSGLISRID